MHLACRLREIRGTRPLRDIAAAANVHRGTLSLIENGRLLPKEEQIPGLERAYGVEVHEFWPPAVLAVINRDLDVAA